MSLDKAEKSSGTRHKARECALQMLFAYDSVGAEAFSQVDYWSELGFEQFHRGANELVWSFLESCERLSKVLSETRGLIKEIDIHDRQSERFVLLKDLEVLNVRLQERYKAYIDSFVRKEPTDPSGIQETLSTASEKYGRLAENIATASRGQRRAEADEIHLAKLKARFEKITSTISQDILKEVDKMITSTRPYRDFGDQLVSGTLENLDAIDTVIRTRAEHWRLERMAVVDRNVLRLSVFEFTYLDTPATVAINEALELARRFSSFEATQFINGVLDGIKQDQQGSDDGAVQKSRASST